MAKVVKTLNNSIKVVDTWAVPDIHGGYEELASPPDPSARELSEAGATGGPNALTENQRGSRWVVGERTAKYICACGNSTTFEVGIFTKFPLKAKCCTSALALERQAA